MRKMLSVTLSSSDFKVEEAESGKEALRLAGVLKPDAIILDIALPDMEGTEVITQIRQWSEVPILVVSERSDASDIVEAFEIGADDYMTKPFNMEILIARLHAALRHSYQKEQGESLLRVGEVEIDLVRHEVKLHGQTVDFSPKEYELLSFFVRHKGKMLTHRQILKQIWGAAHLHDKQYLRVYIMQSRQKIEHDPENPRYIITEAGIGYRFDGPGG